MTEQEIFDKAVIGIVEQGGPATRGEGSVACEYLNEEGKRCALGHCIPESYSLEACKLMTLNEVHDLPELCEVPFEFLEKLQKCHDCAVSDNVNQGEEFMPNFLRYAQNFADGHGLKMPEVAA